MDPYRAGITAMILSLGIAVVFFSNYCGIIIKERAVNVNGFRNDILKNYKAKGDLFSNGPECLTCRAPSQKNEDNYRIDHSQKHKEHIERSSNAGNKLLLRIGYPRANQ